MKIFEKLSLFLLLVLFVSCAGSPKREVASQEKGPLAEAIQNLQGASYDLEVAQRIGYDEYYKNLSDEEWEQEDALLQSMKEKIVEVKLLTQKISDHANEFFSTLPGQRQMEIKLNQGKE